MLKKLFTKKIPPTKVGNSGSKPEGAKVIKYYLSFPSLEGTPTYELIDTLSVGSGDAADARLEEPGISPNHFSLTLNQDIVSLVDHNSEEGTFVNKKRLSPGRMIILTPKDKLRAGPVEFRVFESETELAEFGEEAFDEGEREDDQTQFPSEMEAIEDFAADFDEDEVADEDELDPEGQEEEKTSPNRKFQQFKVVNAKGTRVEAANAVLRTMGLICDALLAAVVHIFASAAPAYMEFLQDLPRLLYELVAPVYESALAPALEKIYALAPIAEKALSFAEELYDESYMPLLQYTLLVALLRFLGSLVLGVTLGQWLAGIRPQGNPVAARLLAPFRFVLGAIFLPVFWVTDFTALFSKRTLKEVLSFTHLRAPSTFKSTVSLLFFVPLLLGVVFTAPVWKDFELPAPILFSAPEELEIGPLDATGERAVSEYFGIDLPMEKISYLLPNFRVAQTAGSKRLDPSLYVGTQERFLEVKLLKRVSLVALAKSFVDNNFLAQAKYPELTGLARDASNYSKNFQNAQFPQEALAEEFRLLLGWSLGLVDEDPLTFIQFIQNNGPFVGAFIDFRSALIEMLGEGPRGIELRQVGDDFHIIGDYSNANRTIKRHLPLNQRDSGVYEVSSGDPKTMGLADLIVWNSNELATGTRPVLSFVDSLALKGKGPVEWEDQLRNLYEVYYSLGEKIYQSLGEPAGEWETDQLHNNLVRSARSTLTVLENAEALGIPIEIASRASQNLNLLLAALVKGDLEFFNRSGDSTGGAK